MNNFKVYRFNQFVNEKLTYDSTVIDSPYTYGYNKDNNQEYRNILDQLGVTGYIIEENGDIDVYGDVDLSGKLLEYGFKYIPVKFRKIYGSFNVSGNELDDFAKFPLYIEGDLDISNNKFKYLYDASGYGKDTTNFMTVEGDLIVVKNPLRTLEKYFTVKGNVVSNINNISNPLDKTKSIRQKLINKNILKQPGYHWADKLEREKVMRKDVDNKNEWFDFANDYHNSMINDNKLYQVPVSAWLNFKVYEWDKLFINNIRGIYEYWVKYGKKSEVLDYNDIKFIEDKHGV